MESGSHDLLSLRGWARGHRLLLSVLAHAGLFALSWLVAFCLAYNFQRFGYWFGDLFLPLLPMVVAVKLTVFMLSGLHRASWRYVSMRDLLGITWAAYISFIWIFVLYFGAANINSILAFFHLGSFNFDPFGGKDFPDSVLLLDVAGTIAIVSGARLAVRLYFEELRSAADGPIPRLLILGAGNAAENVVREILRAPQMAYEPIGFLDDDPVKWRSRIHGLEVFGAIEQVKEVAEAQNVDEILIAMPSASRAQMRRIVDLCKGAELRFKTLPAISDLITGRAEVQQIRDVDINDLLGRAPVTLDTEGIEQFIRNRTVLVTGAGGSIGAEMCRQAGRFGPRRLLLVEQAEQNLFEIEQELRRTFTGLDVVPIICDIADRRRVDRIFRRERPTAVIHAAAHKHVPMMEHNPGEAIKNNVNGTRVISDAALATGVEKFVMISTDKAVNPTSVMGCSKRVAEMYIQALNERGKTQFVTVRFGNVLGSSGSVVPIFKAQIARGGPVTVTHPEMVRYFMTIPEAAQLVLQAASMGAGGEIFVLDMGEPVKIVDLARDLITLSGFRPDEDIKIEFTGMRPGEKLFEELSIAGEDVSQTAHPKIGVWRRRRENFDALVARMDTLLDECDDLPREAIRARLKDIVPEFYLEPPDPAENGAPAEVGVEAADSAVTVDVADPRPGLAAAD